MVFQATVPVAIGVSFTRWELDGFALLAGVLALAGGAVALWAFQRRGSFALGAIITWAALFAAFAGAALVYG